MIEFEHDKLTDDDVKLLEDKVTNITHKAGVSVEVSRGVWVKSEWEYSLEHDGSVSHEKLVNFLRIQAKNRVNYDINNQINDYVRMAIEAKNKVAGRQ